MKKVIFGIFAHPDDEAFCVAATLIKEVSEGAELHLISLTAGEHGMNPDNVPDLAATRLEEWQMAGKILGASSQHHLGYADGTLGNQQHIEITQKIEQLVHEITDGRTDISIEFITLELGGLTGHIDHIVASRSTLMAYYRLKNGGVAVSRTRLTCLRLSDFPNISTNFTLWLPGVADDIINETVDASSHIDTIRQIMQAHHSQRNDAQFWFDALGDHIAINHFIVIE